MNIWSKMKIIFRDISIYLEKKTQLILTNPIAHVRLEQTLSRVSYLIINKVIHLALCSTSLSRDQRNKLLRNKKTSLSPDRQSAFSNNPDIPRVWSSSRDTEYVRGRHTCSSASHNALTSTFQANHGTQMAGRKLVARRSHLLAVGRESVTGHKGGLERHCCVAERKGREGEPLEELLSLRC